MTAAVESLVHEHRRILIGTCTTAQSIWDNNPWVVVHPNDPDAGHLDIGYPLINQSHLPYHFIQGFVEDLSVKLDVPIKLRTNRPHLYFSPKEREERLLNHPYWVINAGYKEDFPVKKWCQEYWQEVVDKLEGVIKFVQIGESHHCHKPLRGVVDMIGKTNNRELLRLCLHADAGIGPESYTHHIFAALQKPYICLLSGMLPQSWIWYPTARFLTMQGAIGCARTGSCWRTKFEGDSACHKIHQEPEQVAECMKLITPNSVLHEVQKVLAMSSHTAGS